jgi:hypothetical protein
VNFYKFLHHKCYKQMVSYQNVSLYEFLSYMCTKASITDFTFVRFFTSMSQVMSFTISRTVETFPTLFTFIWLLSGVYKQMF